VRNHVLEGLRVVARGPFLYMALTFLGIGGLAQQAEVSLAFAVAATVLIWAGPAQVIFLAALIGGLSLPAAALAVTLSSVRLTPMCVSLLPWLRGRGQAWLPFYVVHHIAVTSWVESIRRVRELPPEGRVPFFMGIAHALMAVAVAATVVGYVLAGELPRSLAAGLLFVTPAYFLLALIRNASDRLDWWALGLGVALAPFARYWLGPGFDLLAVGLIGGTIAYAIQRAAKRRASETGDAGEDTGVRDEAERS